MPVEPDGSKTSTEPRDLRCSRECSIRSVLMLAATTGPSHPRMAGTAKPLVLCDWLGPKTITDWADSDASRCLPMCPSTSRLPGNGRDRSAAGTISDRTSPALAQRASLLARSPRARSPGGARCGRRVPIRGPCRARPGPTRSGADRPTPARAASPMAVAVTDAAIMTPLPPPCPAARQNWRGPARQDRGGSIRPWPGRCR